MLLASSIISVLGLLGYVRRTPPCEFAVTVEVKYSQLGRPYEQIRATHPA